MRIEQKTKITYAKMRDDALRQILFCVPSSCMLNENNDPVFIAICDSSAAVAAKAQQDPQPFSEESGKCK